MSGMVVHTFNPSTQEAEAGRFLSSRPAWPTKWVPGQPGLYRETLYRKTKKKKKKKKEKKMLSKEYSLVSENVIFCCPYRTISKNILF